MKLFLCNFCLFIVVACTQLTREGHGAPRPAPALDQCSELVGGAVRTSPSVPTSRRYSSDFEIQDGVLVDFEFDDVEVDERARRIRQLLAKHSSELIPASLVENEGFRIFGTADIVEHGDGATVVIVDFRVDGPQERMISASVTPAVLLVTGNTQEVVRRAGGFVSFF